LRWRNGTLDARRRRRQTAFCHKPTRAVGHQNGIRRQRQVRAQQQMESKRTALKALDCPTQRSGWRARSLLARVGLIQTCWSCGRRGAGRAACRLSAPNRCVGTRGTDSAAGQGGFTWVPNAFGAREATRAFTASISTITLASTPTQPGIGFDLSSKMRTGLFVSLWG
jgi:hypothetical protein